MPSALLDNVRQGKVVIRNWHALCWEGEERTAAKRGVDRRRATGDEAYVRDVLANVAKPRPIFLINDEAHHAWRVPGGSRISCVAKADIKEATKRIRGLDRIHRARGVLTCYDCSATPSGLSANQKYGKALFGWIVSAFGRNDAIESGLVKTPSAVIRNDAGPDAKTYRFARGSK